MAADDSIGIASVFKVGIAITLFAGILKCFSVARRPTANTLGLLSLAVVLSAWLLSAGYGLINGDETVHWAVSALLVVIYLAMLLTGFVLGIIAVIQMARQRGRWTQGRAQAIWGIVLSVLFAGIMVVVVGAMLHRDFDGEGFVERILTADMQKVRSIGGPNHGWQVTLPASGWFRWDELANDYPEADDGALLGLDGAAAIITLPLDGIQPPDRDLVATMLHKARKRESTRSVTRGPPPSRG